jgi:hypothetical protein
MTALAPTADDSFVVNEAARMASLAPVAADGSSEANELTRMQGLAPVVDSSIQQNENRRFADLAGDQA